MESSIVKALADNPLTKNADATASQTPAGMEKKTRLILAIALIVVALLSATVLAEVFSNPSYHQATIEQLEKEQLTVTVLMGLSAAGSAGVGLLPNAGGIATALAELSVDLGIILAAILLQKYLLSILSVAAFRVLIPLAAVIMAVALLRANTGAISATAKRAASKLALFGIALFLVIPLSTWVSISIQEQYDSSIVAEVVAAEPEAVAEITAEAEPADEGEEKGLFESIANAVTNAPSNIANALGDAADAVTTAAAESVEQAQRTLHNLIEGFAVAIVTSCLVPIVTMLFFMWLVNTLLGINIAAPAMTAHTKAKAKASALAKKHADKHSDSDDAEDDEA